MADLIFSLHGELLRLISWEMGAHFAGLEQAARTARISRRLSPRLCRKLQKVDVAFALVRHVTTVSCGALLREVVDDFEEAKAAPAGPPADKLNKMKPC